MTLQTGELLSDLARLPRDLERVADGLTPEQLCWKPASAEFSIVGIVAHLRDLERYASTERVMRMLAEDDPRLADFDGTAVARHSNYDAEAFSLAFAALCSAREATLRVLDTLGPGDLERTAMQEGIGTTTLFELLERLRRHDHEHVTAARAIRSEIDARFDRSGAQPGRGKPGSEPSS